MALFAKLRKDLISAPVEVDGTTCYTVKDEITGNYFQLREPEFWLISQLDGISSPEDIADSFFKKFNLKISPEDVRGFINQLEQLFFLEDSRSEQELSRASRKVSRARPLFSRMLFIRLRAFRPGRLLEVLTNLYRPLMTPFWLSLHALITILGIGVMYANSDAFFDFDPGSMLSMGSLSAVISALFIIIVLHEFAHAVTCSYFGGKVREMGFLLMYFQPCFYCDISDAWLFPKKSSRLWVTAAGPLFQLFLTAIAAIIWRVVVPDTFISEVARIIVSVSAVTYLFNFNPLIKLDGYYLLSDWLEIPNLRARAFACLGNVLKRTILGWPIEKADISSKERKILLIYAILALLYTTLLIGFVLYLVAGYLTNRFGGSGFLLLTFVLLVILRPGLIRLGSGLITHMKYTKQLLKKPLRLAAHLIIVGAVVVLVIALPVPNRVSGEIIIKPLAEYTLNMNQFGLIESRFHRGGASPEDKVSIIQMNSSDIGMMEFLPLVGDGQPVDKDDTIAVLTSNQIVQEIERAEAELGRLAGKLSLLKAPPKPEAVRESESKVIAAKANYEKLLIDYERAKEMSDKDLIADDILEAKQSAMAISHADWQTALSSLDLIKSPPRREEIVILEQEIAKQDARLSFLRSQGDAQVIVTPFDGVVSRNANADLFLSVVDYDTIELLIPVNDFEISRVEVGQKVLLKVRSFPGMSFEGEVVRIPETATKHDGQVCFEVSTIVPNSNMLLKDGMSGYAKIEVGESSIVSLFYHKFLSQIRVEFWSWW